MIDKILRTFATWLIRKLDIRADEVALLKLPKCKACGRHVKHPCDDAEGYHMNGPWDFSCREWFSGGTF